MVCICVISSLYQRRMSLHEIVISPCIIYFSLQDGDTALMMASREGRVECVDKVRAGSHQVLSLWHVPSGIVEVNNVY